MTLLSANDFKALKDAMTKRREIALTRTMAGVTVEARTVPLPEAWEKDMGVQMRVEWGWLTWLQTFDNVGSAQEMLKEVLAYTRA